MDAPLSEARVALGKKLFFDTRLSGNGTQACASCHKPSLAFTDGLSRAIGSTGQTHPRGAMSLANVAYNATQAWANPLLTTLEKQVPIPIFGEHPVELGLAGRESELLARLATDADYARAFRSAFSRDADPVTMGNVVAAISAFERTLLSGNSPYDRYAYHGEDDAISESAKRGLALFNSEDLECFHCHGGFNFADATTHAGKVFAEVIFHNTALYNLDGQGAYPADNIGLMEITLSPSDMGKFKAPTLRNIAVTAPYMHDGSIDTLDGVLDHYAAGGRAGANNPLRSGFINGFSLDAEARADLKAFLESLTDEDFLQAYDDL